MKSILTVISLSLAVVSPAIAGIEWGFNTTDTSVDASVGTGTAAITLGQFGTGWHNGTTLPWNLGSVPGATGLWDLGQAGSIVLSGLSGSGPVTLTVFEWVNSGTYGGLLNFSVNTGPLGTFHEIAQIAASPGHPGAWWEYAGNLGALAPGDMVTVSAGSGGAIIDRLTLVPEPATMIACAILLIPFALSTWPILRRRRTT